MAYFLLVFQNSGVEVFHPFSKLRTPRQSMLPSGKFECTVCQKTFSSASNLTRHSHTHTGNLKYRCLICDRKFQTRDNLTGHMNSHAGAKPFQCGLCLKCFGDKSRLSRHHRECDGISDMGICLGNQMY